MKKTVFITLLQTCMIAGLPRSPVEGPQEVDPGEAKRLVDSGMAEFADIADEEDGDELGKKSVKDLVALLKAEGGEAKGNAGKAELIAAIGAARERKAFEAELAALDKDGLIARAKADEVEHAEDADEAALRDAITAKRFPTAG